jgi:hypothetical protein
MPIGLHPILTILCVVLGFFGGAFLGWGALLLLVFGLRTLGAEGWAAGLLAPLLFLGGAVLGARGGVAFAVHCLPARCPQCGGRTYPRGGKPITYYCRDCGHVHKSWFSASGGR